MARTVGTTVRGIRAPICKAGDNLVEIVVDCVLNSMKSENFQLKDRDIIGITESLVARTQGNYATIDDIAYDINSKFNDDNLAVLFPLLSRNRFAIILKGIALTGKKMYVFLNYPSDEVGNSLIDIELLDELDINPYTDVLTEKKFRELFGYNAKHPITGVDYIEEYKKLAVNDNIEIILANDPKVALNYTKNILVSNIHSRNRTKKILKKAGAKTVYSLDEILNQPVNGSGYNEDFGLLGSNKATEEQIKLFPRDCKKIVEEIQQLMKARTGKHIEVMVYGDGAFKDPATKIWELADPVVSPGYTDGLEGYRNEIKLKYIADNDLSNLNQKDMENAMIQKIKENEKSPINKDISMGTTPRQITSLLGSLCDLTSGSGDKGTPIVLINGYFDNYATE